MVPGLRRGTRVLSCSTGQDPLMIPALRVAQEIVNIVSAAVVENRHWTGGLYNSTNSGTASMVSIVPKTRLRHKQHKQLQHFAFNIFCLLW